MESVVRAHFNVEVGLQAVSVSPSQEFAALAYRTHVQVVQLRNEQLPDSLKENDPLAIAPLLKLQHSLQSGGGGGSGNFTMTDVAWNPLDLDRVASSATNGALAVFNLHQRGFSSSLQMPQTKVKGKGPGKMYTGNHIEWETVGEQTSRAVNRVHWHGKERDTLLSASQDGLVRTFDTRSATSAVTSVGPQGDACRDAQFNCFHPNIIASIHDSGNLMLWDRRMPDQVLLRQSAHTESGLSLDWNPKDAWIIATGSRDKTVKVWDLQCCQSVVNTIPTASGGKHGRGFNKASSTSSQSGSNLPMVGIIQQKPLHVLQTPSNVGRISWRPAHHTSPNSFGQIASASTSTDRGEICIWDISSSTNLPACLLRGHSEGCMGFSWLETVSPVSPSNYEELSHHLVHASSEGIHPTTPPTRGQSSLPFTKSTPSLFGPSPSSQSGVSNSKQSVSNDSAAKSASAQDNVDKVLFRSGIFQHLLTIGKDGSLMVQDLRNAYFPGEHISRHVVAFSAMGHLAYQRGNIVRGDPLALVSNELTRQAKGWFRDQPSAFGVPKLEAMSSSEERGKMKDNHYQKSKMMDIKPGVITIGMSDFGNLADSHDSMGTGAEGGAYDPTVIRHLADNYIFVGRLLSGHMEDDLQGEAMSATDRAIHACRHNKMIAAGLGLAGHAATWCAMESILPSLANIANSKSGNMICDEDGKSNEVVEEVSTQLQQVETTDNVSGQEKESSGGMSEPYCFGSMELMFTIETAGDLLSDMLDSGDCQHFVALCEVIRAIDKGQTLKRVTEGHVPDMRIREGYVSYLDMLTRLRLFSHANALIRSSTDKYISQLSRTGVVMRSCCGKCGKEVGDSDLQTTVGAVWCNKCKRCSGLCVLCQQPVTKMLKWCPICGHGGHRECMQKWFSLHISCPSGCGHQCMLRCKQDKVKTIDSEINHEISSQRKTNILISKAIGKMKYVQLGNLYR